MRRPVRAEMARGTGLWGHVRGARWAALAGLLVTLMSGAAGAHLHVTSPSARSELLKQGPCGGGAGQARGEVVHTFRPGQTITVVWDEFVDHPGHFRVSFDADGQDDFVDPASFTDVSGNATVLIDGIADRKGGSYSQEVTLPDVVCDSCTLQVIQVMSDKPPYGDGNDLYYQCIDVVLSEDAEVDATTAPAMEGDRGCDLGGGRAGGLGLMMLMMLGLMLSGRRRARR